MINSYRDNIINSLQQANIAGANIYVNHSGQNIFQLNYGYSKIYADNLIKNKVANYSDNNYGKLCEYILQTSMGGENNLVEAITMSDDHIADIASLTKIFSTTLIIMFMIQDGKINLEDKINKFFPNLFQDELGQITIKLLLEHRSGLANWMPLYCLVNTREDILPFISQQRLAYKINEGRNYSDIGFIILCFIIEKIYQQPIDQIFIKYIKSPLNLVNCAYKTDFVEDKNLIISTSFGNLFEYNMILNNKFGYCQNYNPDDFKKWRKYYLHGEVNDGNCHYIMDGISSHSGIFSNAKDLFAISSIWRKKTNLLDPEIIELFINPKNQSSIGFAVNNDLGIDDYNKQNFIIGHHGFVGNSYFYLPEQDIEGLLITNRQHNGLINMSYPELTKPRSYLYQMMVNIMT